MDVHGAKLTPHAIHNRKGSGTRRRRTRRWTAALTLVAHNLDDDGHGGQIGRPLHDGGPRLAQRFRAPCFVAAQRSGP
jgi:hypothetical protein